MASPVFEQPFSSLRPALISLGFLRFSEAVAWTSIFPYVYFMVQSFPDLGQSDPAFITGLLVASFTFCEFLSSSFWASASDRIGRKPTLLIGAGCGIITAATFGFSQSIWMALLARVFGGLTNPNVGVIQTCVGEVTAASTYQARAFSLVSFIRSLGTLSGPTLGGNLARPADRWPAVFQSGSIWSQMPFLLPNIAVAVLIAATAVLGVIILPETHSEHAHRGHGNSVFGKGISYLRSVFGGEQQGVYANLDQQEKDENGYASKRTNDAVELQPLTKAEFASNPAQKQEIEEGSQYVGKTFTRRVVLQILSVSLLAFHKVSADVLVPVFLATPAGTGLMSRGLGLSTVEIGYMLTAQAFVMTAAQLLLVPKAIKRFGALQLYQWTLTAFPLLYVLIPLSVVFSRPFDICAILLLLWCSAILTSMAYTCCSVLLTHAAPHPTRLAKVNGAGAAWSCLARSIGPLIVGPLFDYSQKRTLTPLPFWVLAGVAISAIPQSWFLSELLP